MKKKLRVYRKRLIILISLLLIVGGTLYIVQWEQTRARIERENAMWSALYMAQNATTAPAPRTPTPAPTHAPTQAATITPTPRPSATSTPLAMADSTRTASISPTASATPLAMEANDVAIDATIAPLATADENTLVYALETPPPAQNNFADLLALNPDTIGFLRIDDVLSLPVVQRANDNNFYLNHSFNLEESIGGTLFLDGFNLLTPEDNNLIIYGHNMRNGTMFRPLIRYEELDFLRQHPLVHFDSIYENRVYAPFALFTVTADTGSERYLNIRQFAFDTQSWENYIDDMRALSIYDIDLDVAYGDHVLLLVTCEYTHNNGRFVLALRAQRTDENQEELIQYVRSARTNA